MSDIPEQVYRDAARANATATTKTEHRAEIVADWVMASPGHRAAVESAYRAGQHQNEVDLERALAAIRSDPAIMRQLADLAAVSAGGLEEAASACAQMVVALAKAEDS